MPATQLTNHAHARMLLMLLPRHGYGIATALSPATTLLKSSTLPILPSVLIAQTNSNAVLILLNKRPRLILQPTPPTLQPH